MALSTFSTSQEAQQAAAMIEGYRFEMGHHDARQWVSLWLEMYRPLWIRDAVVEALYQGRYKAFSVRQILDLWNKRGQPIRHATREFEAAVCQAYGGAKLAPAPKKAQTLSLLEPSVPAKQRASARTHQSLSAISFNLAELERYTETASSHNEYPVAALATATKETDGELERATVQRLSKTAASPFLHISSARQTPKRVLIETAETLQSKRQIEGTSYSSSRAIQPFKPALPFSAQTLRLTKQKAMAIAKSQ